MLSLIIKGTNGCNLACSYCSLGEKKTVTCVDKNLLTTILCYGCELALFRKDSAVDFIFHGGEPTLLSPDVYKEAVNHVKDRYPKLDICLSMQTNGFSITDEMMDFIQEYDVHMGISLDGSMEIHDMERQSARGEKTYETIIKNIENMQQKGIRVSCLMVLTKNAIGRGYEYLNYFSEKQIPLKINPLLNYGEASLHPELTLHSGDYADYLIGLYEYIMHNGVSCDIEPVNKILHAIINKVRICECTFNPLCNNSFLCVDYNGDIYPCGKFADMALFRLGNVNETSVKNLNVDQIFMLIDRRTKHKPLECRICKYSDLCNAGCTAEAIVQGCFDGTSALCKDYKILFGYFHKNGLILLKDELKRLKKQLEGK